MRHGQGMGRTPPFTHNRVTVTDHQKQRDEDESGRSAADSFAEIVEFTRKEHLNTVRRMHGSAGLDGKKLPRILTPPASSSPAWLAWH